MQQAPDETDALVGREDMVRSVWDRGVRDRRVLEAMLEVPRHVFTSRTPGERVHQDTPPPIGRERACCCPYLVARVLETLELTPSDRVLELGTGCGYQAAILSALCTEVVTVGTDLELARAAAERLQQLGCCNVHVAAGDGSQGVSEYAPYDGIVVAPGVRNVPSALLAQLNPGGYLVIPEGEGDGFVLRRYWQSHHEYADTPLVWCAFVPLVNRRCRAAA